MDEKTKKEIYNKWKTLESEEDSHITVKEFIPGQRLKVQPLSFEKMLSLSKYQKWVLSYCDDLLDISEKWKLNSYVDKHIKCKCMDVNCTKCLLINCKDDDCYFHPIDKKEEIRKRYQNK